VTRVKGASVGTDETEQTGGERHRAREAALQMLYQWEVGRAEVDEVADTYWSIRHPAARSASRVVREFASSLFRGTSRSLGEIDPLIAEAAQHWRLSRMATIDRLVLRIAVYELMHAAGTPPAVVINEALELARTFSGEEAVAFVNGVLDAVRRRLEEQTAS
jgi:transcription antitermination protein NusB